MQLRKLYKNRKTVVMSLPKEMLAMLNVWAGDYVKVGLKGNAIIITALADSEAARGANAEEKE